MKTQKNERKRRQGLVLALLFVLSIGVMGVGYGYWIGSIADPSEKTDNTTDVTVGQGKDITTTIVLNDGDVESKKLVPVGLVEKSVGGAQDNVDSWVRTFQVQWKEEGADDVVDSTDNVQANLTVTKISAIIGDGSNDEDNGLVQVSLPAASNIILDGDKVDVPVTVTLTEPTTKEQYDRVNNQPIKIEIKFSVAQ